jgi:hypothetical protein
MILKHKEMEKLRSIDRLMDYLEENGFFSEHLTEFIGEADPRVRKEQIEIKITDLIIEVHELTINPIQSAIENNKMT